jgi:hypothetical protein
MELPSLEKGDSKFAIKIVRLTLVRQFIADSVEVGRPRNLYLRISQRSGKKCF